MSPSLRISGAILFLGVFLETWPCACVLLAWESVWTKFRSLSAVLLHSVFLDFHCYTKMHAWRERGGGKEGDRQREGGGRGRERERMSMHMKPCSINSASCLLCPLPHAMIAAHNLLKDGGEWMFYVTSGESNSQQLLRGSLKHSPCIFSVHSSFIVQLLELNLPWMIFFEWRNAIACAASKANDSLKIQSNWISERRSMLSRLPLVQCSKRREMRDFLKRQPWNVQIFWCLRSLYTSRD